MKLAHLRIEHILYIIIFLAAAGLRLLLLGTAPLSNSEASWALQAAGDGTPSLVFNGANPAYLAITRLLFNLFAETNFIARLWPALAGSLLVLTPLFFRKWLGVRSALILAAGLAIDPGLAALSRTAGSPVPAVAAVLFAAGAWLRGYPIAAGIFAGIALLTGPGLWPGLISLAAAWALTGGIKNLNGAISQDNKPLDMPIELGGQTDGSMRGVELFTVENARTQPERANWLKVGIAAAMTFLVVGTGFLQLPGGIGAAAASLTTYLHTWVEGSGMPVVPFLMALFLYEILPIVFGLLSTGRGLLRRLSMERFLSTWSVIVVLLTLINPARQPADWVWALVPLWMLAAREIDRHLQLAAVEKTPTLVQFGVGLLVLAFTILTFASLMDAYQINPPNTIAANQQNLQWLVLGGALVLLMLTSYLIAWGWGAPATMRGLLWAVILILAIVTLSSTSRSTGINQEDHPEIWQGFDRPGQVKLLTNSMDDISRWNTGLPESLDILVVNLDTPLVRWALRENHQSQYLGALPIESNPALIVTAIDQEPSLLSSYRGQDFNLLEEISWTNLSTLQWMEWMVFRRVPQTPVQVILWARNDLFADGKTTLSPNQDP